MTCHTTNATEWKNFSFLSTCRELVSYQALFFIFHGPFSMSLLSYTTATDGQDCHLLVIWRQNFSCIRTGPTIGLSVIRYNIFISCLETSCRKLLSLHAYTHTDYFWEFTVECKLINYIIYVIMQYRFYSVFLNICTPKMIVRFNTICTLVCQNKV